MFSRTIILTSTLLLAAAPLNIATAQDRPAEYAAALRADCPKEIKAQCKGVKEGGGRVLACLYSHDGKLGARCAATVAASVERLGEALGALANVRRVCGPDAARLCAGVMPGDGNLVDCLSRARKVVSQTCNATLDAAFLRP